MIKFESKTNYPLATLVCAVLSLGLTTVAMADPTPTPSPTPMSSPAAYTPYNGFLFGTKIVGSQIENMQKQDIGTIDDLVVNPDTGHVRFAVLSVGSFIGKGETKVVVPWGAISLTKNKSGAPTYMIDATKDLLEKAPTFEASKLSELYTDSRPIFDYYTITYFDDVPASSPSPSPSASPKK